MENALLIGLSRQTALARQLDVIANNMANMRTAGFKGENLVFEEYLMPVAEMRNLPGADGRLSYVIDVGLARDFSEGEYAHTGNPLDIAVVGKGWFVVETPEGERYTRDGGFKISPEGELVTGRGYRVLGEGGPITFVPQDRDITFAPDGTVAASTGEKGRLRVVGFEAEHLLEKVGDNLFAGGGAAAAAIDEPRIAQGMIERSNVRPVIETARMIEITRAYTSIASALDQMQTLRRDAIERLGTLPA